MQINHVAFILIFIITIFFIGGVGTGIVSTSALRNEHEDAMSCFKRIENIVWTKGPYNATIHKYIFSVERGLEYEMVDGHPCENQFGNSYKVTNGNIMRLTSRKLSEIIKCPDNDCTAVLEIYAEAGPAFLNALHVGVEGPGGPPS